MTNQKHSVLYTGMPNHIRCRVAEHRSGEISGFTAQYGCHKLVYCEDCTNALDTTAREKRIKNWSRAKKVKLIATLNPTGWTWQKTFSENS